MEHSSRLLTIDFASSGAPPNVSFMCVDVILILTYNSMYKELYNENRINLKVS